MVVEIDPRHLKSDTTSSGGRILSIGADDGFPAGMSGCIRKKSSFVNGARGDQAMSCLDLFRIHVSFVSFLLDNLSRRRLEMCL